MTAWIIYALGAVSEALCLLMYEWDECNFHSFKGWADFTIACALWPMNILIRLVALFYRHYIDL